ARMAGAPGSSATTCVSQIFSTSVRALVIRVGGARCWFEGSKAYQREPSRPAGRSGVVVRAALVLSGDGPSAHHPVEQAHPVAAVLRAVIHGVRNARRGPGPECPGLQESR